MKERDKKFQDFQHIEFTISKEDVHGNNIFPNQRGIPQSIAWLMHIPLYMSNIVYIYDGSIKDDDIGAYIEGYHDIFRGLRKIMEKNIKKI